MSDVGKAISASFAFVSEVGKECEALADLIKGEISALFSKDPLIALYKPGEWSSSYRIDESGWVFNAAAWTLPLTPKGKRKATAHLAFQITFLCNDAAGGFSPEPLIHINLWDDPTDVRYDNYMGFEMRDISPRSLARFQEGTASLFRWETENGAADRWTFSLRLAQINSLDDIREQICKLIRRLLIDVDEGEAAVHETSGVIRWSVDDTRPDHYRIVR